MKPDSYLPFESTLKQIQAEIDLASSVKDGSSQQQETIRQLRQQWVEAARELYSNLTPWQTVQVARHKDRPHTVDYLSLVFDEFVELHGDKFFGDDRAIRTGFAKLDDRKVMVIGHQKGRNYQERTENFFGCAHPEGYRKAMGKMKMAAKFGLPVICLIDTPGAYPGVGAEERGQAQVIAESMFLMSQLKTPIVCIVIGEGGSGGALGIGVGDKVAMLQHAYYSVISPEGCAGILWKSSEFAELAADALKFTSQHLSQLGVVDDVLEEPLAGAHRDPHEMANRVKSYLLRCLDDLTSVPGEELVKRRYDKFRKLGMFLEADAAV